MKLATLRVRWFDVVIMIVEEVGEVTVDDGVSVGVGVGKRGGRRRGERSLSFRLKTGRSPKGRIHLTEGQTGRKFRKKFKVGVCELAGQRRDGGK